ncbi:MAG: MerR family transcriptional regulator [Acidimicrobiia bacterium]|nr:MerR family transcriptional regulator [Acidimicrobiia bacterium]
MSEYRVQELARQAGISVELLRSYQSKGLLPPPRHEGRVAWYGPRHLERLRLIRDLKDRGYSLRMIERVVERGAEQPEDSAVAGAEVPEERLTLAQLAERSRVPPAMLRSLEASGVLRPRRSGRERWYTEADVRAVRMLLSLLGGGLPMEEFMRVAAVQLDVAQKVADGAIELFMAYARAPLLEAGLPHREEAERMVASLRLMMHSATALMTYNFQRMVLAAAQRAIEKDGSHSERAALKRELERRRVELAIPA